jgi:acetoin utilization protein AcuC
VAYVDIDVHHGDGVQDAFYDSDQVLTISLHQDGRTLFPGTGFTSETGRGQGVGFSVNVPFPSYTDDETYLWAFHQVVPPLLERFKADILVTQLGVDTHIRDPLANLALTTNGQAALFSELKGNARRWLALGGGGYDISVVPRSWALALGIMADLELPEALPLGYQSKYGGQWLRDREAIRLEAPIRRRIRASVEELVTEVKDKHGLV